MILVELFRTVVLLPLWIANVFLQRKQRTEAADHEIERLDRIRNPDKYLGK